VSRGEIPFVKPAQAVSLIETAYGLDGATEQWLQKVAASACAAMDSASGAMAFQYDASDGNWIKVGTGAVHEVSPEFARDFFSQEDMPKESARALTNLFMSLRFGSLRAIFNRIQAAAFSATLDRHGIHDMVGVNGLDPSGRGCMLVIVVQKMPSSSRTEHLWQRLAAHISAGNRLRTTLEALSEPNFDPTQRAEAVLTANGKVEHATGPAEPRAAREALREALVRIDKARSEQDDARRSVELWRGLVVGRWSLVEHFESDGKRYYLAHKNDPELAEDRGLTPRERLVLGYAELGQSNKLIGYALGLSSSTVSTLLARARKKLASQS
jgi:DNA-directed RNA polymerase specialized sigma24 family protein